MHRDLLDHAGGGGALLDSTEVECASDAEIAHDLDVVLGEVPKMVGAKKLPPAQAAPIAGWIAAEIAEIAGAGEIEVTGREVCHWRSLSHLVRRRNDVGAIGTAVPLCCILEVPGGEHDQV